MYYLYQTIPITAGKTYQVSFDYVTSAIVNAGSTMYTGFGVDTDFFSEPAVSTLPNATYKTYSMVTNEAGTKTFKIIAGGGQDSFFITNTLVAGGTVTVDNDSVNKVAFVSVIDSGILSNYDFDNFKGDRRNMRAGFLTTAGNDGKLQYRYTDSSSLVTWINLMTGLTIVKLCFCSYWDNTALIKYVLWVDGSNNVSSWNGAVTTLASATSNTLTTQGSLTWQQLGFTATGSITIGGVTATYSGGYTTGTLTGVSVDLSNAGVYSLASEIHQTPVTTAISGMTDILATFAPTVIGCGMNNQIYLGSSTSNNLYISKKDDYKTYTVSTIRLAGEGAKITLDAPPTKFLSQEVTAADKTAGSDATFDMWISEGKDTWAIIRFVENIGYNSSGVATTASETVKHLRLKTSPLQGAMSERLVSKMKNHIMYIGSDKVASFIGYISYQFIPTIVDFSFPIIDDMNSYDFTDGSIFYHKNFAYVTLPKHSLIRVYNMTDQTKDQFSQYKAIEDVTQMPWFWESPIAYPISGFYVVDGELYGHNYTTSESYKLFTGGSFNGQDITADATFAFDSKGDRTQSKASDELWIEGYIKQNTLLSATVAGDLNGCQTTQTTIVDGSDNQIVCFGGGSGNTGHSLGQDNLGSKPLGGAITATSTLPAWFHVAKTYPQVQFYLEQISFGSKGVDLQWELICFGTNARMTPENNNSITQ